MAKKEMKFPLTEIGGRIQQARLDKGLDRLDFYNKVYGLKPGEGIDPGSKIKDVYNWESSTHLPTIEVLAKICKALDVSTDYILFQGKPRNHDIEFIQEYTHLSEQAILNILYEGSETGNNQRVCALDWLLSDRETFTALMDELLALVYPMTYYLTPNVWKKTGWVTVREDNSVEVNPSFLRHVSDKNPDNIYQRIRNVLDDFISKLNEKGIKYVAPQEFNPFILSDIEEESERLEELRQKAQEEIKQKKGGKKK